MKFTGCKDGPGKYNIYRFITDMLGDFGVEEVLLMTDLDLQATTSKLISRANEEGGKDNITVVLVRF